MIKDARKFILEQVDYPALEDEHISDEIKKSIKYTSKIIERFKKTGDLYNYMKRYGEKPLPGKDNVYKALKKAGLKTYEDIFQDFEQKFINEIKNVTILDEFIEGKIYSTWDIIYFAGIYDPRSSGIMPIHRDNINAIFVKATLSGGNYPNKWLILNEEFKYYMYGPNGNFNPKHTYNNAIIESNGKPIFIFARNEKKGPFTLLGRFKYIDYTCENDGSKWFRLRKIDSYQDNYVSIEKHNDDFEKEVDKSKKLSKEERNKRLANAPKKPDYTYGVTKVYKRNPDVVVEVLERADGVCERCHKPAPFKRASDGSPYLEVHHVVPLSQDGDDTVENAIAVCPNCHMEIHHG